MHNTKLKRISVALCMALLPISVFAAGLGKLNVDSGIGEPLRANIELLSVSPEELASITASIASVEAYATQGIERPSSHNGIKVEVAKNANGTPMLKLKSSQPISEPFLDMLIQVDWNLGRLLREYTVLLDPPGYTGESADSGQDNSTTQAPMVKSGSMPKESSLTQEANIASDTSTSTNKSGRKHRKTRPATDAEAATSADVSGQEYVTQKGDTLAKIAADMKPEGVSLEQMLVGLYQTNPDAFSSKNMNRLNVGKIIRPPSEESLNVLSRKEAAYEIKVQTANWNAYRNKLAGMVADSAPATEAEVNTQSSSGKIKTATEDKSMPASAGPKDVVKLSAGDAKIDSAEAKASKEKIAALQEEVTAREKAIKEAQDRAAALEKQVADMQKLLALKNNAMSDMQKQAAETKSVAEQKPAEVAPVKPSSEKPVEVVVAPAKPATPEPANAEVKKPIVKPMPSPESIEQPSFVASMMDNLDPSLLGGAGGVLALLGGGWMILRNKRKKNLADFEQGIMTSGGLKANTVFGNTSSSSVDTGDTSFLTDFSQSANGGMIDTNDVDPIAEAEVYMAYGRDAQAEEILKDAISKEPKRYELHLKLLEMYAASNNMSAFETVSGELYTTLGADDPTWAKVAEIGIKLEPTNPLYQAGASPTGGRAKVADIGGKLDANDFVDSPIASEKDLAADKKMDFSFDNDSLTKDFAADASATKIESIPQVAAVATAATALSAILNRDRSADAPDSSEIEIIEIAKKEDSGLNFDLGELDMGNALEMSDSPVDADVLLNVSPGFSHTMPELDMSKFDNHTFDDKKLTEPDSLESDNLAAELPTFEMMADTITGERFELPNVDTAEIDTEVALSAFEVSDVADDESFNFDITKMPPTASESAEVAANTMDLSGISLEMEETGADVVMDDLADEPADVETKLELVAAYIDMDDKEGAKELLDEVIKEGGANQRKRADALLKQIA